MSACARDMAKIREIKPENRNKVTELFSRYQCDTNGNYLPIQCSDSECYCVEPETGYFQQIPKSKDSEALSSAIKSDPDQIVKLFCYKEYKGDRARLNDILHISPTIANRAQNFM